VLGTSGAVSGTGGAASGTSRSVSPTGVNGGDQSGVGLISTVVGFAIFAVLLLLAVQVAVGLYTRTVASSVGFDAARIVSGADAGASPAALESAEALARQELGGEGARATFEWSVTADQVGLRITVPVPTLLPSGLAGPLRLASVTRGVTLRRERVR